jgi:hypothetical protein
MGDIEVDHGAWRKNQIRFANLRQVAEGSVALRDRPPIVIARLDRAIQ